MTVQVNWMMPGGRVGHRDHMATVTFEDQHRIENMAFCGLAVDEPDALPMHHAHHPAAPAVRLSIPHAAAHLFHDHLAHHAAVEDNLMAVRHSHVRFGKDRKSVEEGKSGYGLG